MVSIDKKFKGIPRREIDTLEDVLEGLFKLIGRSECWGKERSNIKKKPKPFAHIHFGYGLKKNQAEVRLEGRGISRDGDYDVHIKINLLDETYSILMQNLEKRTPILARTISENNPTYVP